MKVFEISYEEFQELEKDDEIYFANGCFFYEGTDNLIAFTWFESYSHSKPTNKYYKVLKEK